MRTTTFTRLFTLTAGLATVATLEGVAWGNQANQ